MAEPEHLYDTDVDLGDLRFTYGQIASRIPRGATVLDVGCAGGKFGEALARELSCVVLGVDNNSAALALAEGRGLAVILADITREPLDRIVGGRRFDVIVFADVLEHLVSPEPVLLAARDLLQEGGRIMVSFPNIAHVDIGLMLAQGEWRYRPSGLLDDTHLRFYTLSSFSQMAFECGLDSVSVQEVRLPFMQTEVLDFGNEVHVDQARATEFREVIARVNSKLEVYQYVLELAVAPEREGRVAIEPSLIPPDPTPPTGGPARVSVLVRSAPGRSAILTDALAALGRQSHANLQLILAVIGVAADAAEKLRLELSEEVRNLVSRTVVISQGAGGLARAINQGLDLADGDYLAVVDDDDILAAGWVEQMATFLVQHAAVSVAFSGWRLVTGTTRGSSFEPVEDLGLRGESRGRLELFVGGAIPISACLIRVQDARRADIRADELHDHQADWVFLRTLLAGHEFQFVSAAPVECHLHEGRLGPAPSDGWSSTVPGAREIEQEPIVQSIRARATEVIDQLRQRHQLEDELRVTRAELARSRQTLEVIMISRSWRLTRWLRRLSGSKLP